MIAQAIADGLVELDEVKRWLQNEVDAGDTAVQIHVDALDRARASFDEARQTAARLAEVDPDL